MLIRIQHFTSTAIDDLRVSFECASCHVVSSADVITASAVEVTMPIYVPEAMREGAASDAVANLPEAARQAVGLAGCPACGATDRGIARTQRILCALAALGAWYGVAATVIAIVVGVIGASASSLGTRLLCIGCAVALVALAMGLGGRVRFAAKQRWARSRVTWLPPAKG